MIIFVMEKLKEKGGSVEMGQEGSTCDRVSRSVRLLRSRGLPLKETPSAHRDLRTEGE